MLWRACSTAKDAGCVGMGLNERLVCDAHGAGDGVAPLLHGESSGTAHAWRIIPSGRDALRRRARCKFLLASAWGGISTYSVVDFSERMVAAATSRLGDRAQAFVGDSCSLPFPDGSFDRYISNLGLCCVQDVRPLFVPAMLSRLLV